MKTIVIMGKAGAASHPQNLEVYDHAISHDDFADYLDGMPEVKSGNMMLHYIDGTLYTVVEYGIVNFKDLTEDQLKELVSYTSGQLSDGIGEGFEQQPVENIDGEDYYVSPWFHNQHLVIADTIKEGVLRLQVEFPEYRHDVEIFEDSCSINLDEMEAKYKKLIEDANGGKNIKYSELAEKLEERFTKRELAVMFAMSHHEDV